MAKNVYTFTPEMRVVLAFLWKVDEKKSITVNGAKKTVGDGKFKLRGYVDPTTAEGAKFFTDAATQLKEGNPDYKWEATGPKSLRAALDRSFLTAAATKAPEGIPATWRRLTAKTDFGPVEVIDTHEKPVSEGTFFPGVWAIANVSWFTHPSMEEKDPETREGYPAIALRLSAVLLTRTGERIKTGGTPSAAKVFSGIIGGQAAVDPFGD